MKHCSIYQYSKTLNYNKVGKNIFNTKIPSLNMINLIRLLAVTTILFLIFVIATDLSAATSKTANIELVTSPIYSGSAVINPDTRYSPVSGDKIVDQGALGQYTQNNYLQFDAFDFHGDYQGNNAQEFTPIPDPTDTVSIPSNFPVLGNVFTLEVQV